MSKINLNDMSSDCIVELSFEEARNITRDNLEDIEVAIDTAQGEIHMGNKTISYVVIVITKE